LVEEKQRREKRREKRRERQRGKFVGNNVLLYSGAGCPLFILFTHRGETMNKYPYGVTTLL
jgi:hypothetical protein